MASGGHTSCILLSFLVLCGAANATPGEKDPFCTQLKAKSTESPDLFFRDRNGEPKRVLDSQIAELAGRNLDFYYLVTRPKSHFASLPLRGALSIKTELGEPDAKPNVQLFNNHQKDPAKKCLVRNYDTYQAFHLDGGNDNCLRLGFHNPPGHEFPTSSAERRPSFLFPTNVVSNFLELGPPSAPVRRMSYIFNFVVLADAPPICIPYNFFTSRELSTLRTVIDDLLPDRSGNTLPRLRIPVLK